MNILNDFTKDPKVQKRRWWTITTIGLYAVMATLDTSIINVALPVISHDLTLSMSKAEWIVSIYLVVICALLLVMGSIGDFVGKVKIYRTGTILFTLGSFLADFDVNFQLLLIARVIEGVGAAMTMANSMGIISEVFSINERGRALGLFAAFTSIGSIAGPAVVGLILSFLPWGYIFWINVPVGTLAILIGLYSLPNDLTETKIQLDWSGIITMVLSIIFFYITMNLAQQIGFINLPVVSALFATIFLLASLIHFEKNTTTPLIPLSLFSSRSFSVGLISGCINFVIVFFSNIIMPFYLENERGFSAYKAGIILMIFPLVQIVISPLSGILTDKMGPHKLLLSGAFILGLSQIIRAFWGLSVSMVSVALVLVLLGFGNGLFQSPNNTAVMTSINDNKYLGIGGSLYSLARELGMIIGVTLSTTILFNAMSFISKKKVLTYPTGHPAIFMFGFRTSFFIGALLCLLTLCLTVYENLKKEQC